VSDWPPFPPLAFATGHVLLLPLDPDTSLALSPSPGLLALLAGEAVLVAALVLPSLRTPPRLRRFGTVSLAMLGLVGVVLGTLALTDRLWMVATALLLVTGTLCYGVHRYELLVTGQVEVEA
jgi:hypothetical protein